MTFDEKEKAQENKQLLLIKQNGKCLYFKECHTDFVKDNIYPEAAHIIIDSKVNIRKYGYEILRHPLNFVLTCKNCNSKAILNPETQSGKNHIQMIKDAIAEE
ncbi:MAG: hypothetical protein OQL19_18205 [Gammaproteobacteria bacterium]|nr:hypothetical protein [Gammaproteobacteria bacterium]